jgi:hypothetical protein
MKRILLIIALVGSLMQVSAAPLSNNSNSNSSSVANSSQGISTSGNVAGNSGVTISSVAEAPRMMVNSAFSAPLTSSGDTCMGSTSMGASGAVFSVSGGTTWTDKNCVMLKNSRELWNMGLKPAALARMCMDEDNRIALEQTGTECPATTIKRLAAYEISKANKDNLVYNGTDPIVRARLGLPPVK